MTSLKLPLVLQESKKSLSSDEIMIILHFWSGNNEIIIPSDIVELLLLYSVLFDVNFIPKFRRKGYDTRILKGCIPIGILTNICIHMQGFCYKPLKQGIFTWKTKAGIETTCSKILGITTKLDKTPNEFDDFTFDEDKIPIEENSEEDSNVNNENDDEIILYYYHSYRSLNELLVGNNSGNLIRNISGKETKLFRNNYSEDWYWKNNEAIIITVKLSKKESFIKFEKEVKMAEKNKFGEFIYKNEQNYNIENDPKIIDLGNRIKIEYGKKYFIFGAICNRDGNKIYFCQ